MDPMSPSAWSILFILGRALGSFQGLTAPGTVEFHSPWSVVPVLAIGAGQTSPQAIPRALDVVATMNKTPLSAPTEAIEVWELDAYGRIMKRHVP
jgi:hypothetical protein